MRSKLAFGLTGPALVNGSSVDSKIDADLVNCSCDARFLKKSLQQLCRFKKSWGPNCSIPLALVDETLLQAARRDSKVKGAIG